ncbi:MAG: hypothetical protein ACLPUO_07880 [Streptosporangiaceae bacterium]|jgi:hypothetical protein
MHLIGGLMFLTGVLLGGLRDILFCAAAVFFLAAGSLCLAAAATLRRLERSQSVRKMPEGPGA